MKTNQNLKKGYIYYCDVSIIVFDEIIELKNVVYCHRDANYHLKKHQENILNSKIKKENKKKLKELNDYVFPIKSVKVITCLGKSMA